MVVDAQLDEPREVRQMLDLVDKDRPSARHLLQRVRPSQGDVAVLGNFHVEHVGRARYLPSQQVHQGGLACPAAARDHNRFVLLKPWRDAGCYVARMQLQFTKFIERFHTRIVPILRNKSIFAETPSAISQYLRSSFSSVIPPQARIHSCFDAWAPRLRGGDKKRVIPQALFSLASFCPRCEVFFKARGAPHEYFSAIRVAFLGAGGNPSFALLDVPP